MTSYKKLESKTRAALEEIGFSIQGDGNHWKCTFKGDGRYVLILPKSGSDFRGGKNSASDFNKILGLK
ncbi:hypothetical protein LNQ82_03185 [Conchiformibius steedae DSM 2580]|uniref:Uncharacterized protein n=1 Tax=Conchiformibius steedae DSM 2580 TaxID=1121352 RepID=A0AAE9L088_9NEIS|nr:hypothetical protein [Conchiformibius steedae]QMT33522.1 hypothetical protein H3L98_10710 [Conchiformibius steedae]URD68181.1 hypothetical protein LNQ82_03185 [Conchiformibius steedae DSM 2580]